jgi:hypothetical protein
MPRWRCSRHVKVIVVVFQVGVLNGAWGGWPATNREIWRGWPAVEGQECPIADLWGVCKSRLLGREVCSTQNGVCRLLFPRWCDQWQLGYLYVVVV